MKLSPGMYICIDGIYADNEGIDRRVIRIIDITEVGDKCITASDGRIYEKERIRDVYIKRHPYPYPGYIPLYLLREKND